MGFLKSLVGIAAPIVGGIIGGPAGAAIGSAVGGAVAGKPAAGGTTQAQAAYAAQGGLQTPGAVSQGSVQSLPDWYTNYAKQTTNNALGMMANLPTYQGYTDALGNPAPQVAGLSGTQQQGINTIKSGLGQWQSGLSQAKDAVGAGMITNLQGQGRVGAAGDLFNKASGAYQTSLGTIDKAQGQVDQSMNTVQGALNTFNKGQGQIDAASGALGKMGGALDASMGMLPGAQNYLTRGTDGSEFSAENMSRYMNPYTDGVVKEIARLGARNLNENLLPGVNSTFTGAGQFGSSRNMDFTNRAVRDTNESILGQQSKVLADAQAQALGLAQSASERNLAAGSQTGALAGVAQGAASGYGNQAGTQINQGQATVGVGNGQLGAAAGQLAGANTTLSAAQGQQQAGAGFNQTGNNTVNQGLALGQLGSNYGQLGQQMGGLAQAGQNMNLSDAQALMNAGAVEQSTDQRAMDAAYRDFLDRRDYPLQALGALSSVMPNVSGRVDGNTQTMTLNSANAPQPVSKYQAYADILGGLSAVAR